MGDPAADLSLRAHPSWRARLEARWARRIQVRPTRVGLGFTLLLVAVLLAAVNSGNNLLYVVLAGQLAILVLSNLLAEMNLRGLELHRRLPPEIHAGQAAPGACVLVNRRKRLGAWTVHIEELDGGEAHGLVLYLPPGQEAPASVRWRLPRRGLQTLGRVRLWSEHPFGLVRRSLDLSLPAEVLVFPAPGEVRAATPDLVAGSTREDLRHRGREGDFQSLRPYQAGDPLRDLHWPTTARTGRPMVVERAAAGSPEVLIRVEDEVGARWERALSRAAGEIDRHSRRGDAVGLVLEGQVLAPNRGDGWRRRLLSRLALAPVRDPSSAAEEGPG